MQNDGFYSWLGLAAFVLGYDTWAIITGHETMTSAFARAIKHPAARWPVLLAWAITTLHLFGRLPDYLDPYKGYGKVLAIVNPKR